jgi:hypothetical protein
LRHFYLLLFLSLLTQFTLAKEMKALRSDEISQISYTRLQKIHIAYIEFFIEHEENLLKGKGPRAKKETTFNDYWRDLLIQSAYAFAPNGTICFFGGWPSRVLNSSCQRPWTQKNDSKIQVLGSYHQACGANHLFRCNPVLFGKNEDGQGFCINTQGSFNNLTERCERETRAQRPKVIEAWQEDPSQLQALSEEIKNFCDSYEKYDACDDLAKVIEEITGQQLGEYSGEGFRQEALGQQRTQGRNRNVAMEGEFLSPNAKRSNQVGVGQQILQRCADLLERDPQALFSSPEVGCVDESIILNLANINDISKVARSVDLIESVSLINAKAFEQNILAYLLHEIRFGDSRLDLSDKNRLFENLTKNYPHVKNDPRYKQAFEKAYLDLDKEARTGRLYPINLDSTREQFNNLATSANRACARVREAYKERFGDAGRLQRYITARSEHQEFFKEHEASIFNEISSLMDEAMIGHLMATTTFKNSVIDPRENYVDSCARSEAFQVVKTPISNTHIRAAHNEVRMMMVNNLQKIDHRQRELASGQVAKAQSQLNDFLKNDATLTQVTMASLDEDQQKSLGYGLCQEAQNALRNDRFFRIGDHIAGAVGIAGAVITMTGVGAPVGGALLGASAIWGAGRAVQSGSQGMSRQSAADQSLALRRDNLREYFDKSTQASAQKREALISGGLSALAGFPAIRIVTASRGTAPAGSLVTTQAPQTQVATRIPARATNPRSPSVSGGATSSLDDTLRAKPLSELTPHHQNLVRQELSQIISTQGTKLPSQVVPFDDIATMSLAQARQKLMQIANSSDAKNSYRKAVQALHPDKHSSRPQAIKDAIHEEMKIINELKKRILQLNGGKW